MKKSLILFAIIVLFAPGLAKAQISLPCCDDHGTDACVRCGPGGPVLAPGPPIDLFPPSDPGTSTIRANTGEIPERGEPEIGAVQQVVTPAKVLLTVMGPDGTVYLVSDDKIQVWKLANPNLQTFEFDFEAAIGESQTTLSRSMFLVVAFRGSEPFLLWTAKDKGYATYVTSLRDFETTELIKQLIARDMTVAPNGDFYIIGEGTDLTTGVHRFSESGSYLQSFAQVPAVDPERVLATGGGLFVQSAPNVLDEYSFMGAFRQSYVFDDMVKSESVGLIHGLFVKDGTVHVGVISASPGAKGSGCLFGWNADDTMTLYQLVDDEVKFHSTGTADLLLYGIAPNGSKVARSLLVGSASNPVIQVIEEN